MSVGWQGPGGFQAAVTVGHRPCDTLATASVRSANTWPGAGFPGPNSVLLEIHFGREGVPQTIFPWEKKILYMSYIYSCVLLIYSCVFITWSVEVRPHGGNIRLWGPNIGPKLHRIMLGAIKSTVGTMFVSDTGNFVI